MTPAQTEDLTPNFADDRAHITAISGANAGRGFPFVDEAVIQLDPRPRGGLRSILMRTAEDNGLTVEDLMSPTRARAVTWPRQEFMWRARQVRWANGTHRYSLPFIATFLGLADHTTVLHGVRRFQQRLDEQAARDLERWKRSGAAA